MSKNKKILIIGAVLLPLAILGVSLFISRTKQNDCLAKSWQTFTRLKSSIIPPTEELRETYTVYNPTDKSCFGYYHLESSGLKLIVDLKSGSFFSFTPDPVFCLTIHCLSEKNFSSLFYSLFK